MELIQDAGLRRWMALGTGVSLDIGERDLRVTIARVRPAGASIVGSVTIENFRERPAVDWGKQYNDFLKQHGARHLTATVLLPRQEIIVRQLAFPGVPRKDLAAAIQFQIESLHPYPEDQVLTGWAAAGAGTVLIGLVQRAVVEKYAALFSEAAVRVSSFTFSAAVLHSAVRLLSNAPGQFLGICDTAEGLEVYGESPARPVFSALLDLPRAKALDLAASELRLPPETEPLELSAWLPKPARVPADYDLSRNALGYAAALAAACPWLSLKANLLPVELRATNSRWIFIPTLGLAAAALAVALGLAAIRPYEDRRFLAGLQAEITQLEPRALRAGALERSTIRTRARTQLIGEFRKRSKADLDVLNELTKLLPPPAWLSSVQITSDTVTLAGETEQAAGLLKVLDESPLFRNSEFVTPITRNGSNEVFHIRTARREGQK